MNNLDHFFNQKLGSHGESATDFETRHPFLEQYWLDAEKLIEAEERRRRFFGWLAAAGLAILLAGSWYFLKKNEAAKLTQTVVAQQVETDFSKNENIESTPNLTEQQISSQYQNSNPTTHGSASLANRLIRNQLKSEVESTNQPITNNQSTNPGVISKNSSLISVNDIRNVGGEADESSVSHFSDEARKTVDDGQPIPNLIRELTAKNFDSPSTESLEIQEPSAPESSSSQAVLPSFAVDFLPNPLKFVHFSKIDRLEMAKVEAKFDNISKVVKSKNPSNWSFGLLGGGYFMPENLGKKNQFGGAAGVFAEKKLVKNWSAFSEIRLRFRPDEQRDSDKNETSERRRYSFGFERDTFSLARKSAFWLEIPLGLRFSKNKLATNFGFAPGFLTGIRGLRESFSQSSFERDLKKTASDQVWMADENYKKSYFSLFAGADFQLNRSFAATFRANYLLQNLENNNETEGFQTSKLGLELGLKVNLK